MNELTDFICGCCIQIGNYCKIKKNRLGWLISILCIIYWASRAMSMGLQSQLFWHMISLILALYGYYSWSSDEPNTQKTDR